MAALSSETVQAGCVAIGGRAALIEGRSEDARADLLLQLVDRGALLVASGRTICLRDGKTLLASPPPDIAGRIEVRGIGSLQREHAERIPVELVVVILDSPPRNPEERRTRTLAGIELPVLALGPADTAGAIKVELALEALAR